MFFGFHLFFTLLILQTWFFFTHISLKEGLQLSRKSCSYLLFFTNFETLFFLLLSSHIHFLKPFMNHITNKIYELKWMGWVSRVQKSCGGNCCLATVHILMFLFREDQNKKEILGENKGKNVYNLRLYMYCHEYRFTLIVLNYQYLFTWI
jgi:hypothetical protein